jgi:hypothetical protein
MKPLTTPPQPGYARKAVAVGNSDAIIDAEAWRRWQRKLLFVNDQRQATNAYFMALAIAASAIGAMIL